jgi:chromate transporter
MPPDSPLAAAAAPQLPTSPPPGLFALFLAFAKMSLSGFGGVLAFARRGIVEQQRWMTAEEFNETFALCHFLPGPNIVNLTVVFGSRFRGIPGSIAAFAGLIGPPVVLVTVLAALYARFGEIDPLRRILAGWPARRSAF